MKRLKKTNGASSCQSFGKNILLVAVILILPQVTLAANQEYGAESNPTGNPIGGGPGYHNIISPEQANFLITNKPGLISALAAATPGQIIYIDDKAEIDLSGLNNLKIPANITLASGRGRNGSKGALLYSQSHNIRISLFLVNGDKVRITGLRLYGTDTEMSDHTYGGNYKLGDGISSGFSDLEVDNCEIYGWGHAGIYLTTGSHYSYIHHNYIHHNRRYGLGYGVCLGYATASNPIFSLIEGNLFDYNRHHIAATGTPGNSYEARYNISLTFNVSHCFDMHGGADRGDGTNIAGDSIRIHHNTFRDTRQNAVCIRGIPQNEAKIHNNWFYHDNVSSAVRQTNATGNISVYDNFLGIVPPSGTALVAPKINVNSQVGISPMEITFDGSNDPGPAVPLSAWYWKFGDGNSDIGEEAQGKRVKFTFMDPGRYNVMLTVSDNDGITNNTLVPVTVIPTDRAIISFWIKDSFREDTPGYFRKEVLLDGVNIWQEDIAGDQKWEHVCIDVTDRVFNKASIKIALRVTCLKNISFPDPLNLYTYTGFTDLFVFLDDVTLFGLEVKNGDFESAGNWTYSEGNGTIPSGSFSAMDARSGYSSFMLTFPYLGKPVAGAWAQVEQIVTNQSPNILTHYPDSTQVSVDSKVSITFSEPMHRSETESAFSILPFISGRFQWEGNKMIFIPEGSLLQNQHYTVSTNLTARDLAGKPLISKYLWEFRTISEPPIVVYPNPLIKGFNPGRILFSKLPRKCRIKIYNAAGKLVATLEHYDSASGGTEEWNPAAMDSGVYLYRIEYPSGKTTGKLSIVR